MIRAERIAADESRMAMVRRAAALPVAVRSLAVAEMVQLPMSTQRNQFADPPSRFTWLGWALLAALFFGGGFITGWAAAILSTTK